MNHDLYVRSAFNEIKLQQGKMYIYILPYDYLFIIQFSYICQNEIICLSMHLCDFYFYLGSVDGIFSNWQFYYHDIFI